MSDERPPDLRQLDTSKARKDVVLTRRQEGVVPAPDKGAGSGRRARVLGFGAALTGTLALGAVLLGAWLAGAAVLVAGAIATVVMTARAVTSPPAASGPVSRVARLQQRLDAAEVPDAARQELRQAMRDLLAAREREVAAEASIDATLSGLDPAALRQALARAETGGDAEEIGLRRQAMAAYDELAARREGLRQGFARTEAALDALDVTLAQAATPAGPEAGAVEADTRRMLGQVEALRRATAELSALEDGPDPRGPGRERA